MKFLAVAAHPDDIEFNAGGTLAQLIQAGWSGAYLVCTDGAKGTKDLAMAPHLKDHRRGEQRVAAKILGVSTVAFLDFVDGELVQDLALRKGIVETIRRVQPDIVLTWDSMSRWIGDYVLNHPDHLAVGEATGYAVYPSARDDLMFPDLLASGLAGWKTAELWLWATNQPNLMVDVERTFALKIDSLGAHASQADPVKVRARMARTRARLVRDFDNTVTQSHQDHPEYIEEFRRVPLDPIGPLNQWLPRTWSQLAD